MLSTLDPHSMYFPYNEFKKLKEDQDSRFYGIGVTIVQHRDGVYIQSAVEGTPAGRLGLRYGDRILEVDGQDARDWSSEQVSKKCAVAKASRSRSKLNAPARKRHSISQSFAIQCHFPQSATLTCCVRAPAMSV